MKIKTIKKALMEVVCRLAPDNYYLPMLTFMAKIKCFKVVEPFVWWYIAGSKYNREYEESMRNRARLYIAYDGCFDMGHNFGEVTNRGWFLTSLFMQGTIHPYIKNQIVEDHKEEYPLDYCLMQLTELTNKIKNNVVNYWQLCTIYVLGLVIANLV